MPTVGQAMSAAEESIVTPPVESVETVEMILAHEPGHKSTVQTHERFYFNDGNVTFMVCASVTPTTLGRRRD